MKKNDFEKYPEKDIVLKKDWLFPYSQVEIGSKVIIYGAGDVGQSYINQLSKNNFCTVNLWVDKNYSSYRTFGIEVESVDCIKTAQEYDYIVIAVSRKCIAVEIYDQLTAWGIEDNKIIWNDDARFSFKGDIVESRLLNPLRNSVDMIIDRKGRTIEQEEKQQIIADLINKATSDGGMVIPRLVVEVTSYCSLKCSACNNLMPRYSAPQHLSFEDIVNDINQIASNVNAIVVLEIIGGEPFLYPDLGRVVEYVATLGNIMAIEITTNGTIIPSEEVLQQFSNSNVTVRISDYPGYSKIDELKAVLSRFGVNYEILDSLNWIDSGDIHTRGRSIEELRNIYFRCNAAYLCKMLLKGKIFECPRAASLYDLGLVDGDVGYLDIYNSEELSKDLKDFWLRLYDGACDHCDCADAWRQIEIGKQKL